MTDTFRHATAARAGVLVANLGTPDAPTPAAVRRYLAEFLSDRRVVDLNPLLWKIILHGIILRFRPPRVARAYASIWSDAGSPLLALSRNLAGGIANELGERFEVAVGMCYGNPSIPSAIEELQRRGVRRLVVLPLYPQYSATTTAAATDALARSLQSMNWLPELRVINHYHDHPGYIEALARSVRDHWEAHGRPQRLVMSFHGIPERYHLAGDPYPCECRKTARLLAEALELDHDDYEVTFQSRFGREPWVQPYTDFRLEALAKSGTTDVQVICPGFAVDCLETLEEIEEENRELFLEAGGQRFSYIPALNDADTHAAFLASLVHEHAAGWPELAPAYNTNEAQSLADASAERAVEAGAPA
ncbi:MAG: ferrochelatase [Pseudomonadota bacterium]